MPAEAPSGSSHLSLLAFTQAISRHVNSNPSLQQQWVVAELADFRMHGLHAYGQLLEKDAAGRTVARIQATIWGSDLTVIREKFEKATGRQMATGMKLLLRLTATHNPIYGLSANISDVDPSYTLGDMERLRREILERLHKEGVLEANRRLSLSPAPQRIAVISAEGAAGYGDFINQLSASGFAIYPRLFSASMQGERTVPTVMAALDSVERTMKHWDCVVIIRGGGATSDLNAFDNYDLARRVALFPLPVIVGIGHERDNTVLDYIAHTRCKTPTAVAAFITDRLQRAEDYAAELTRHITDHTRSVISSEQQRLAHLAAMLPVLAPGRITAEQHRMERLSATLSRAAQAGISRANTLLADLASRIARSSATLIASQRTRLESIPPLLHRSASQRNLRETERLESLSRLISVLSPDATLSRGYSITRVDGKAVRSAAELPPGAIIETTLSDGKIQSEVKSKSAFKNAL
ncbi:MAG: exodeoxyribonuclease VII large subunit [Muribaculaceae bacterium]|nr:exodeoxyribonuclease VII large subunit [Muribaculaceae bacterium]